MRASYRMESPRDEERTRRESTILRNSSASDGELYLGRRTSDRPFPGSRLGWSILASGRRGVDAPRFPRPKIAGVMFYL